MLGNLNCVPATGAPLNYLFGFNKSLEHLQHSVQHGVSVLKDSQSHKWNLLTVFGQEFHHYGSQIFSIWH